jgi:hypothetical protein
VGGVAEASGYGICAADGRLTRASSGPRGGGTNLGKASITAVGMWRRLFAIVLAVLSYALFGLAAASIHAERSLPFSVEEAGPIPAALSGYLFGTPHGLIDSGLDKFFREDAAAMPAETAVQSAIELRIDQAHDRLLVKDGNGIGSILMVRAAFALFGPHAYALPYFLILVLGISALAFVLRYQDWRIAAVPIVFTGLTLLPLTAYAIPTIYMACPFGGVRSYAIAGILAALHWCFAAAGKDDAPLAGRAIRWALLIIQIAILGFAILVRGSPVYLLGPVFVVGAHHLWRNRSWAGVRAVAMRVVVPTVALFTLLSMIAPLAFPEYVQAGRDHAGVWHRVFVSFDLHPAWPFPGLREKYPCPLIPEGLVKGGSDRSGHCVWLTYVSQNGLSIEQGQAGTYDAQYEAVLRRAVWYVVRTYPVQTFETFFYVKPRLIIGLVMRTVTQVFRSFGDGSRREVKIVVMLQFAILLLLLMTWPLRSLLPGIGSAVSIASLFPLFGLVPPLVVWPGVPTTLDFVVYVLCAVTISIWLLLAVVADAAGRHVFLRH